MTWREDNLSATAKTNLALDSGDRYELAEWAYPSGSTQYLSMRDVPATLIGGSNDYERRILRFPVIGGTQQIIREAIGRNVNFPQSYCTIDIDDAAAQSPRFYDSFLDENPEGSIITLYHWTNANSAGLADRVLEGIFKVNKWSQPEPYKIRLQLIGLFAGIENRAMGRVIQQPDSASVASNYSVDRVPDSSQGRVIPLVFGDCKDIPLLAFNLGVSSFLQADLTTTATAIRIQDDDGYKFPSTGTVQIGTEEIVYSSINYAPVGYDSLVIDEDNYESSRPNPAFHSAGVIVAEKPKFKYDGTGADVAGWIYLVADHKVKALDKIFVNGRLIDSSKYSLINYGAASAIIFGGQDVAAVLFTTLPRIAAIGEHNVSNVLLMDGQEFNGSWSEAAGNQALSPLNAFGDDPSLPAALTVDSTKFQELRVTFDGDESDGDNIHGLITKVFIVAEYAAGSTYSSGDAHSHVLMTPYKDNNSLLPLPTDSSRMLSPPQGDDFQVSIPEHTHTIDSDTKPEDTYDDTRDLFKSDSMISYGWVAAEGYTLANPDILEKDIGFSGDIRPSIMGNDEWFLTVRFWTPSVNFPDIVGGSQASTIVAAQVWSGIGPWYSEYPEHYYITATLAQAAVQIQIGTATESQSAKYSGIKVQVTARGYASMHSGGYAYGSFGINAFMDTPAPYDRYSSTRYFYTSKAFATRIFYFYGDFTRAQVETLEVSVWPFEESSYIGVKFEVRDIRVWTKLADVATWDLEGANIPIVTDSEAAIIALSGTKMSNRMIKKIDIMNELSAWAVNKGVSIWDYFSPNSGGSPEFLVQARNTEANVNLALYNLYFEFHFKPIVAFSEETIVTADVRGLPDTSNDLIENPTDLMIAMIDGVSANGFDGLGLSAYRDTATFTAVKLLIANYAFARQVTERLSYLQALYELKRESRTEILNELGKYLLVYMPSVFSSESITFDTDDMLNALISIDRSDTSQLVNKLNVYFDKNYKSEQQFGAPSLQYNKAVTVESSASQNEPWGLQEKDLILKWHNSKGADTPDVSDLANYFINTKAYKENVFTVETGVRAKLWELTTILDVTSAYLGLDSAQCMIIGRQNIAPHKVQLQLVYQQSGEGIVWESAVGVGAEIISSQGDNYLYIKISGVVVARIDGSGNIALSGELQSDQSSEGVFPSTPISFSNSRITMGYERSTPDTYEIGLQWWDASICMVAKGVYESQDLSSFSVAASSYYESDTDNFRIAVKQGGDIVLIYRSSDGAILIGGQLIENQTF